MSFPFVLYKSMQESGNEDTEGDRGGRGVSIFDILWDRVINVKDPW